MLKAFVLYVILIIVIQYNNNNNNNTNNNNKKNVACGDMAADAAHTWIGQCWW